MKNNLRIHGTTYWNMGMRWMGRAALVTGLTVTAGTAHAALINVSFTGVVNPGSYDSAGIVYGQGISGQVGDIISGSFQIDTALMVDTSVHPQIGTWSTPNWLFPQTVNNLSGSFMIDGVTVQTSQHMSLPNGHSIEIADVYDINPTYGLQDYLRLQDGSQMLSCSDVNTPSTCSGGSLADSIVLIRLWGNLDFLQNPTLEQNFDLDSSEIASILSAGGGQDNQYYHWQLNDTFTGWVYDARGTFNLTSLSYSVAQPLAAVSEPSVLALLAFGLVGLGSRRHRRGRTQMDGVHPRP